MKAKEMMVWRSSSGCRNSTSHHCRSSSSSSSSSHLNILGLLPTTHNHYTAPDDDSSASSSPLSWRRFSVTSSTLLRSLLVPKCRGVLCRRPRRTQVTGTLFGNRKGHVSFAIQAQPNSPPLFLIQLPSSTSALVKEMSSGFLRIALDSQNEPTLWTMYCNGRKCNTYAASRACSHSDIHLFETLQSVSAGAGVIPQLHLHADDLLYMRANFDRVVGSRGSEAFYMLNPEGNTAPDLTIFLLSHCFI